MPLIRTCFPFPPFAPEQGTHIIKLAWAPVQMKEWNGRDEDSESQQKMWRTHQIWKFPSCVRLKNLASPFKYFGTHQLGFEVALETTGNHPYPGMAFHNRPLEWQTQASQCTSSSYFLVMVGLGINPQMLVLVCFLCQIVELRQFVTSTPLKAQGRHRGQSFQKTGWDKHIKLYQTTHQPHRAPQNLSKNKVMKSGPTPTEQIYTIQTCSRHVCTNIPYDVQPFSVYSKV